MQILTNEKVMKTAANQLMKLWLILAFCLGATSASAAVLEDVTYSVLPAGKLEIRMSFDTVPPDVKSYSIEQPARIALDLVGATSGVSQKIQSIDNAIAKSVVIAQAKDRTRLIVNLVESKSYTTRVEGDQLVLLVGEKLAASVAQTAPAASDSSSSQSSTSQAISNVDFRRGETGEGLIVVSLSSPSISVDVNDQGGVIFAKFSNASVAEELQRRLDVIDFATPVQFVDTKFDGKSTIMEIEPNGDWEYLAYQTDKTFIINVKPVSAEESKQRNQDSFQYSGEKLSLSFQDIEVRSVLQLIADFTSLNLVASDTVGGKITLRLQNVPWDQALDLILKTKGLDKRQVGNVLLVGPADEIAKREALELESQKKIAELAPLRTEYLRINYAKSGDLKSLIQSEGGLLSSRGSIAEDERTNTLIIQDTADKLEKIKEVIRALDIEVRQVLIEARIVTASNDVANEIGVRWGVLRDSTSGGTEDGSYTFGRDFSDDAGAGDVGYVVDLGVDKATATTLTMGFLDLDSGLLELELSALDSEGSADLISTPKVLTADQQEAKISSGQEVAIPVVGEDGTAGVEIIEAELSLNVTPAITPEGKVLMEIEITNNSIAGISSAGATINTNELTTSILAEDGETVVLGGIYTTSQSRGVVKTPFLGDLPWIGNLFRRKIDSNSKAELLIFITPRLVNDALASN